MSKKDKKKQSAALPSTPHGLTTPLVSKRGWKLMGLGLVTLVAGYTLLSFADSLAQNLPGKLSPFVILVGYGFVGIGIIIKDPLP